MLYCAILYCILYHIVELYNYSILYSTIIDYTVFGQGRVGGLPSGFELFNNWFVFKAWESRVKLQTWSFGAAWGIYNPDYIGVT